MAIINIFTQNKKYFTNTWALIQKLTKLFNINCAKI
jgi:hypothetical protein